MAAIARLRWVLLLSVLVLAVVATSSYLAYQVGGRVGFLHGFSAGGTSAETTNGRAAVFALNAIRAGDLDKAISILETVVDGSLVSYWGYLQVGNSEFDTEQVVALSHRVMAGVADYRESYPSVLDSEGASESISEALAYIRREP